MSTFLDYCRRNSLNRCFSSRIASLSLGGKREFYLKDKANKKLVEKYLLWSGDMVVMQGETQSKWLHSIPKRTNVEPRIKYI